MSSPNFNGGIEKFYGPKMVGMSKNFYSGGMAKWGWDVQSGGDSYLMVDFKKKSIFWGKICLNWLQNWQKAYKNSILDQVYLVYSG